MSKQIGRILHCLGLLICCTVASLSAAEDRPNIVVIFTDDQGYGDLGCYGATNFKTPRLDALAKEGTRFTSFYAQVVCGPSRSALLTGRYPNRSLGWSMPASEITIAELLKQSGYATGCVGKWDVSNRAAIPDRMPHAKGFDYYFGTLGANDDASVVLHENDRQLEETRDMASLTRRYTDKSIEFIRKHRDQPFFLYLAHTMMHSVIDASPEFRGTSMGGLYGDTMQELDYHSGRLLDAIDELGLRERTLVLFTTDNGAWNNFRETLEKKHAGQIAWGSSGPLREGKGSTYEGGLRVPCLARWPGKVPAGRESPALFATIDFLPTFAALAGAKIPNDRLIDGVDQSQLLLGSSEAGNRRDYFYFCKNELHAVRKGDYKLLLPDRRQHYGYVKDKGSNDLELYNLAEDIGEVRNLATEQPEKVRELLLHATSVPWPDTKPDDKIALANTVANRKPAANGRQLVEGDWENHGFGLAHREEIRRKFQAGIDRKVIPGGALLIAHQGEVILREAYGRSGGSEDIPFEVNSPCYIASLTKPHTATLLAILADQGKLDLDATVDRYLPEFGNLKVRGQTASVPAPTLRQCLSHTAGFPGNDAERAAGTLRSTSKTLAAAVSALAEAPLATAPGSKFAYTGSGYLVAGRAAEVVTGRSFQDLMRRHLLEAIGAEVACFLPSAELRRRIPFDWDRREMPLERNSQQAQLVSPGGGMVSTLDDVARLMLLHRNRGRVGSKQVIAPEKLAELIVRQPATTGTGYGLGFNLVSLRADGTARRVRHTGASGTFAMLDFEQDLIVIVLTQVEQPKIVQWRNQLVETIMR